MAQLFPRSANALARGSIVAGVLLIGSLGYIVMALDSSTYNTRRMLVSEQPVPFSHEHHVAGLGIDCRYCHTSVEKSSFAGIPPTATCMNCHKEVWKEAPILEPVRESFRTGQPIRWNRVYDLPDFVYFDHSIHIAKGIGCASCHGRIDKQPLTAEANALQMKWCLDCHRDPAKNVRPREEVFNLAWQPPADRAAREAQAKDLVDRYKVRSLTYCSTCHR